VKRKLSNVLRAQFEVTGQPRYKGIVVKGNIVKGNIVKVIVVKGNSIQDKGNLYSKFMYKFL